MVRTRVEGQGQRCEAKSSTAGRGRQGKRRRVGGSGGGEEEGFDRRWFCSPHQQTIAYKRTQRILTMSKVAPAFLAIYRLKSLFDFHNISRMLDMGEDVFEEPVRDVYTNLIWDEGQQALKGFLRGRAFWIRAEDIHEFVSVFHPDIRACAGHIRTTDSLCRSGERFRVGPRGEGDVAEWRPPTDVMIAKALADNEQMDPAHISDERTGSHSHLDIVEGGAIYTCPKGGDKATLTDLVKIIMVCLIFKRPLDLSRLIMMMMRQCAQQGRRAMGCGKFIIALLRKEQFDFSPYHPMMLESAIVEEKVTTMTEGERTRRARAQVQEERAQKEEEEEESEEGSEFKAEGSGSAEGEGTTDFQRAVLELLRGVDGQLKGMRASLGTRVLAVSTGGVYCR